MVISALRRMWFAIGSSAVLLLGSGASPAALLDVDGDGTVSADTDGQLVLRHLFGFGGVTLVSGAIGAGALRDAIAIENYLAAQDFALDVDADGNADALTDGVLILRHLLGRTGAELTDGALSPTATRDAADIAAYIDTLSDLLDRPAKPLNDTGIDWCADATTNNQPCPVDDYTYQDAQYGRDVTHNDDSDGHAGFSFTKLDANGNPLAASASSWSCVRDNVTGLIWEVKTDDGGLRDKDWTYSWYNTDATTNGGSAGYADQGDNCFDPTHCDTAKYVDDVNAPPGLCGFIDGWRLPSVDELMSIVSNDRTDPAIDKDYFEHAQSSFFWTSTTSAAESGGWKYAWDVYFGDGYVYGYEKFNQLSVRLVRPGQ